MGRQTVTEATQRFSFTRRSLLLSAAQLSVGGLLVGRAAWLAIAQNEKYSLLSESNRVQLTLIPPRRGWIIDRHGQPIAKNRADFRVDLIPDRVTSLDAVLKTLTEILDLSFDDVERIRSDFEKAAGFQPVQVADKLEWEKFAALNLRLPELPGVMPARGMSRDYPEGAAVAHLVGYVGAASADQYKESRDPLLITPGFKVGKDGLEKTMDLYMRGKPGARRSEVTARGKLVRDLAMKEDIAGKTLKLTVDAGLQAYAARRLGRESGSVVVFDCTNGDILTMASMPAYDPNSFTDGISHDEWDMLSLNDHLPLMNKSLQALYPPGSTVKPMATIAFQRHGISPQDTVFCNGGYRLGSRFFRCEGHHGAVDMPTAIMKSCNTYFYTMGHRIGYDKIAEVARELGLGQEFTLPFPSQRYGTVPDSEWKLRKFKKPWGQFDTLNASIGQGYVLTSPFQLAVMALRIATGKALMPRIIAGPQPHVAPLNIPPEHLAVVHDGMNRVVNAGGTATRSQINLNGITMAGKTGSAQVRGLSGGRGDMSTPWKYRDHALFVGFAPADNPRYAIAVVVDHGIAGARAAAPVAKDVLTYLFDPAKAMASLLALEKAWGGTIKERMERETTAYRAQKAVERGEAPPPPPAAEDLGAMAPSASSAPAATTAGPVPSMTAADPTTAITGTPPTSAPAETNGKVTP
jgi:penicillin-binding protein 2